MIRPIRPRRDEPLVDRVLWFIATVLALTTITYFGAQFLYYLIGG
jgi:hypothetical protein